MPVTRFRPLRHLLRWFVSRWFVLPLVIVVTTSVLLVAGLRWANPPISSYMLGWCFQSPQGDCSKLRYRWTPWSEISPHLALAVVAAEDQRFPSHNGFDVSEIWNAINERISNGRQRGASTITQQVARNLFLWSGRSYVRKGLEAWFTLWIEALWPKQRILEVYLNIAEFANATYGAGAAAQQLFSTSASQLTVEQAAKLAAVLPNPRYMQVNPASPYVSERYPQIIDQMAVLGADYLVALSDHRGEP